jgi:methionyl-tRNA formyltransferase
MTPGSMPSGSGKSVLNARCVLFAYHEAGYACMKALLYLGAPVAGLFTHRDAPDEEIWWRSCAELAAARDIPVYTPEKLDDAALAAVHRCKPDVIYSAYYRSLIPSAILELAPLGAYNLHGSLLPKYRGRAPVNWMLVNGERQGGVTLHHMVVRADAGDIVAQRSVAIDDEDTALTLYRKLLPLWGELIHEYHPLIVAGSAPRIAQDLSLGSYYGRRGPEDGRIDWSWPSRRTFNLVRAVTHPYPGAFCFARGRKLFIWDSRITAESGKHGQSGIILGNGPNGEVEIAAGEGRLMLRRAQFENQSENTAASVLGEVAGHGITRLE